MGYLVNAYTYRLGYHFLWVDDWFGSRTVNWMLFHNVYFLRALLKFFLVSVGFVDFKLFFGDIRVLLVRGSYNLQVFLLEFNRGEFFFRLFFKKFFLYIDKGSINYWKSLLEFFGCSVGQLDFWRFQITGVQFVVFCFCVFFFKFFGESLFLTVIFPSFFFLSSMSSQVDFVGFFSLVLFFLKKFNVSNSVYLGVVLFKFLFFRFLRCFPFFTLFFSEDVIPFESVDPVYFVLFSNLRAFFCGIVRVIIQWFFRFYWYFVFYRWIFFGIQLGFYKIVSKFCFFPVFISFFFLGFREVSVRYIGFWLVKRLALFESWNMAIKTVQEELFELIDLSVIFGFKIQFSGRFTRRQRSILHWVTFGRIPFSSKSVDIDYFNCSVMLKNGVGCVKVWLYYNFEVGQCSVRLDGYETI